MKISAVCFDLGKVLLDFDKDAMLVRMAQKSPLSPAEMAQAIQPTPINLAYETGEISTAKFFAHLKKLIRYKGTARELLACYNEIFTPMPERSSRLTTRSPSSPTPTKPTSNTPRPPTPSSRSSPRVSIRTRSRP
jgi:hypothetical protein